MILFQGNEIDDVKDFEFHWQLLAKLEGCTRAYTLTMEAFSCCCTDLKIILSVLLLQYPIQHLLY